MNFNWAAETGGGRRDQAPPVQQPWVQAAAGSRLVPVDLLPHHQRP